METTVTNSAIRDHHERLMTQVGSVAFAAAALGVGVGFILGASSHHAPETDVTDRLLSGGNRDRILNSLAEYERGEYVAHDLVQL